MSGRTKSTTAVRRRKRPPASLGSSIPSPSGSGDAPGRLKNYLTNVVEQSKRALEERYGSPQGGGGGGGGSNRKKQRRGKKKSGESPSISRSDFSRVDFDATEYIKDIFETKTPQDVHKSGFRRTFELWRDQARENLKDVVYAHYEKFIAVSQEITEFHGQVVGINEGLEQLKGTILELYRLLESDAKEEEDRERGVVPPAVLGPSASSGNSGLLSSRRHWGASEVDLWALQQNIAKERRRLEIQDDVLDVEVCIAEQRFHDAKLAFLRIMYQERERRRDEPSTVSVISSASSQRSYGNQDDAESQDEFLVSEMERLKSKIEMAVLQMMKSPFTSKSEFREGVEVLRELLSHRTARDAFLQCRSQRIQEAVQESAERMSRGDVFEFVLSLTRRTFGAIVETQEEFQALFGTRKEIESEDEGESEEEFVQPEIVLRKQDVSVFMQWVLNEIDRFSETFRVHVFADQDTFQVVGDCVELIFQEAEKLKKKRGISLAFRLEKSLKSDIVRCMMSISKSWKETTLRTEVLQETWSKSKRIVDGKELELTRSGESLFNLLLDFGAEMEKMPYVWTEFLSIVEDTITAYLALVLEDIGDVEKKSGFPEEQAFALIGNANAICFTLLPLIESVCPRPRVIQSILGKVDEVVAILGEKFSTTKAKLIFTRLYWGGAKYPGPGACGEDVSLCFRVLFCDQLPHLVEQMADRMRSDEALKIIHAILDVLFQEMKECRGFWRRAKKRSQEHATQIVLDLRFLEHLLAEYLQMPKLAAYVQGIHDDFVQTSHVQLEDDEWYAKSFEGVFDEGNQTIAAFLDFLIGEEDEGELSD